MEDHANPTERRKSERVPQSFPVYTSKDLSEYLSQESVAGLTRDINSTGLSFLTQEEYRIGDVINLKIDLPSSHHHFRARVTHVERLGESTVVGVAFLDMSSEHQKALIDALCLRR